MNDRAGGRIIGRRDGRVDTAPVSFTCRGVRVSARAAE
jgi:hypothetical protein